MEKDMANYMQYKMGYSERILMNKGVLPSKFHCQQDRCKRQIGSDASSSTRPVLIKKRKLELIEQLEQDTINSTDEAEVQEVAVVSQEPIDSRSAGIKYIKIFQCSITLQLLCFLFQKHNLSMIRRQRLYLL